MDNSVLPWFALGKNPNQALNGNGARWRFPQQKPGRAQEKGLFQQKHMLSRGPVSKVSKRVLL